MLREVIYQDLDGKQYRDIFHESGKIAAGSVILWDESVDGPVPKEIPELGCIERVGKELRENTQKKAAIEAAKAAEREKQAAKKAKKEHLSALKDKLKARTASQEEKDELLESLLG